MGKGLAHLIQNMQAAILGLIQRDLHNFRCDRCDFDIHLQGGDAGFCTSNLKVHITKVILITQNVRQDGKFITFLNQAHRNTGNRARQWHTCIHHGQRGTTNSRHR